MSPANEGARRSSLALTGCGLVTAVGDDTESSAASVESGLSGMRVIRIPDRAQRERAFQALLGTGESWVSASGNVMGLSSRQVKALQAMGIAFEWVSKAAPHG